ncbi:MAG TPA: cytochrome c-type biogenesis protein CcmH [Pseudomonadales bacterium]|nr:cytochrome c-type biogenesis protein CcmH [Pseudomonadales bacterium]
MRRITVCLMLLLCCSVLYASIDAYEFQSDEQRHLYQKLTEELRCPKCQNQNLADSDSQIAEDLRKELYQQLLTGKSENEIIDFMRERYGDFVLYKPRMQWNTLFLWLSPLLLVLVVALRLWLARNANAAVRADIEEGFVSVSTASNKPLIGARWINGFSLLALLAVALGSFLIYRHMGSVRALQITDLGRAVFSHQFSDAEQARQQNVLLGELDNWLTDHPNDAGFVYMRARLLSIASEWDKAIHDYQQLVTNYPDQDNFLAEYAQTLFLKNNRALTDDVRTLLQRALEINPHNVTALGLLGMAAFEQKDYRGAVTLWERLLQSIPQGTPQAAAIAEGVAKARELGGLQPTTTAELDIKLRVQVNIAASANAQPTDVVFVLLRAKNGPRMPLAVVKTTVAALADGVVLDTATSPMKGQIDLSAIDTFEVVARLSRSGQPVPAVGDWEGVSEPLQKGALPDELRVTVAQKITQ